MNLNVKEVKSVTEFFGTWEQGGNEKAVGSSPHRGLLRRAACCSVCLRLGKVGKAKIKLNAVKWHAELFIKRYFQKQLILRN